MRPKKLDHVALNVPDPPRVAAALVARLPLRILQETDEFVLVGRRHDLGKLTLVATSSSTEAGPLVRVAMAIPCAMASSSIDLGGELSLELVPGPRDGEVDLDHVALRVPDPGASARAWPKLGFERVERVGQIERVRLGNAFVELHPGAPAATEHPLLGHVGLLVASVDQAQSAAADAGVEILRTVDAENSRAVFVAGPDGIEVELVEHLPSFALV